MSNSSFILVMPTVKPLTPPHFQVVALMWHKDQNAVSTLTLAICIDMIGWLLTPWQLSRVGLGDQGCQDICVDAHFVPPFGNAAGDKRHCVFDGPHFEDLWQQYDGAHDALRTLIWHKDQKCC